MLEQSSQWIEQHLSRKAVELEKERLICHDVHHVLEDMVYDIETCHSEQKIHQLEQEIIDLKSIIKEHEESKSKLLDERQKAYEYADMIEQEGKQLAKKLEQNLQVVVNELIAKKVIEQELAKAQEQIAFSANLAKELANAQREIRELHRKNSIQKLMKTQQQGRSFRKCPKSTVPTVQAVRKDIIQKPNVRTDHFGCLEEELLMNIFAFLDANSVFAVSITSHPLMDRVHTMFHMISTSSSTSNNTSGSTNVTLVSSSAVNTQGSNSFNSHTSPSGDSTKKKTLNSMNSSPSLLLLQKPSKSFSSLLSSNTNNSNRIFSTHHQEGGLSKQKLSKVERIVNSLNKNEMKLFHEMSTHIKTLENSILQNQIEKEDLLARLQNTETVKDFLLEKLQENENILENYMEEKKKNQEQTILDREIMGFLDTKIQEYENTLKKCAHKNEFYKNELKRIIEEHEAKTTIIQDMVKLLTEEKQDLQFQLKSQRKVLVKEVKVLRAQNQHLLSEKNQCCTQLKQLKVALSYLEDIES